MSETLLRLSVSDTLVGLSYFLSGGEASLFGVEVRECLFLKALTICGGSLQT